MKLNKKINTNNFFNPHKKEFIITAVGMFGLSTIFWWVLLQKPEATKSAAACQLRQPPTHRCDAPCYCPRPGNPLANIEYCKYCYPDRNECEVICPPR